MQSFLGEYPNSRKNPEIKFIRAINSFLNQINDNCELIIVSDGCDITTDLYNKHFKHYDNIRCVFVERDSKVMYDKIDDKIFYRGTPRQKGLDISTGEIITYMDSDDFLLPEFTEIILSNFLSSIEGVYWFVNQSWYDSIHTKYNADNLSLFHPNYDKRRTIEGLRDEWVPIESNDGVQVIHYQPWTLSHLKVCDVVWKDSIHISEDILFTKTLSKAYNGYLYENPCYVRCHLKDVYDY